MTPELEALARRAVACPRWRWMPGMLVTSVGRIIEVDGDFVSAFEHPWKDFEFEFRKLDPNRSYIPDLPDLTDPATLGCLLALVREAWRCPTVYVRQGTTRRVSDGAFAWEVCDLWLDAEACRALGVDRQGSVGSWGHGSEAEALVAALENGGGGA